MSCGPEKPFAVPRRATFSDLTKIDYVAEPAGTLIDVKGPIVSQGRFETTATTAGVNVVVDRLEGLARSAVNRLVVNDGLNIPTTVVVELFNLSPAERQIVLTLLNSEAQKAGIDVTRILIIY